MNFLKKVQNLDIRYRKLIFWFIIVILIIGLGILFLEKSEKRLENFKGNDFLKNSNFPNFGKELENLWPKGSEQKMEEMNKTIEEIGKAIKEEEK